MNQPASKIQHSYKKEGEKRKNNLTEICISFTHKQVNKSSFIVCLTLCYSLLSVPVHFFITTSVHIGSPGISRSDPDHPQHNPKRILTKGSSSNRYLTRSSIFSLPVPRAPNWNEKNTTNMLHMKTISSISSTIFVHKFAVFH